MLGELIQERHGLDVRAGIGEPGAGVTGMHRSYRNAAAALRIGPALDPEARVFAVTDLRVPQLVAAAVRQDRSDYAAALLDGLRDRADWPTLRDPPGLGGERIQPAQGRAAIRHSPQHAAIPPGQDRTAIRPSDP
jgi:diguanylate cyclase with GGDEF domain